LNNSPRITSRIIASGLLGYAIANLIAFSVAPTSPFYLTLPKIFFAHRFQVPLSIWIADGIFVISLLLPLFLRLPAQTKYGFAKVAKFADLKKMNILQEEGIILGKAFNKILRFRTPPLSVLILAPSGTGKTSGIIIPNLLYLKNSLIVHDPKGELTKKTALYRQTFSKVKIFDPVSIYSSKFNPLANSLLPMNRDGEPDINRARVHIERVATTLIPLSKSADNYFEKAARSLLIYLGMWLLWHDKKTSIPEIRNLLLSQPDAERLFKTMQTGKDPRKEVIAEESDDDEEPESLPATEKFRLRQMEKDREYLSEDELKELEALQSQEKPRVAWVSPLPDFIYRDGNSILSTCKSEKQLAGVLGTLNEQLAVFADEVISNNTKDDCEFIAKNFRQELTTLYVVVRDEDKERLRNLTVLLFETIANQISSSMPGKNDLIVTFMLDEFIRLGQLKAIRDLPEISRGYKANIIFVAQDYGQIESTYDKSTVSIFESNCAYRVIFRQNNQQTAKKISETIGKKTDTKKSYSHDKSKILSTRNSESVSEEGLYLFSDQDIMNLPDDKSIVLAQGFFARPIMSDTLYYFKDSKMIQIIKKYGFDDDTPFETIYQKLHKGIDA